MCNGGKWMKCVCVCVFVLGCCVGVINDCVYVNERMVQFYIIIWGSLFYCAWKVWVFVGVSGSRLGWVGLLVKMSPHNLPYRVWHLYAQQLFTMFENGQFYVNLMVFAYRAPVVTSRHWERIWIAKHDD